MPQAFGFTHYVDALSKHLKEHFARIDKAVENCKDLKESQSSDAILKSQKQKILDLAHDCTEYHKLESLNVGIFGEWGSGKSKLLRGVEQQFKEKTTNIVPIFFNVWRYEKDPHIIVPLFKTLQHRLIEEFGEEDKKRGLLEDIRILTFSLLSGFELSAEAHSLTLTFSGNDVIDRLFEMQKESGKEADNFEIMERIESVYYNIPQKIEAITLSHDVRFLFLIDDLDRCLPENALKMLESIKLFLDIPGCAFVLAVDDDIVERGVAYHYKSYKLDGNDKDLPITGSEYLEKMIQLPFALPVLHDTQVGDFLRQKYPDLFEDKKEQERMFTLFAKIVVFVPRKIIRVAELFALKKKLLPDMPEDDLLKLVCLELFTPSLYREAKRNFASLPILVILGLWKEKEEKSLYDFERLDKKVNDEKFPKIKEKYKNIIEILKKKNQGRVNFDLDGIFEVPIREDSLQRYFYIQNIDKSAKIVSSKSVSNLVEILMDEDEAKWLTTLSELEGNLLSREDSKALIEKAKAKENSVTSKWLLTLYPHLEGEYLQELFACLSITLKKINSGSFKMGSDDGDDDEKPIHEVVINYDFEIAKYPVTFEEYDLFCEDTGKKKPDDRGWGRGKRPVINVSWHDAKAYCEWLNKKLGLDEETGYYRLPTEAEWEYSCRAGTTKKWSFGDDEEELTKYAWYDKNSNSKTHPVGEKLPNPWGLYDMHGNVWEWCEDDNVDNYHDTPRDGTAHVDEKADYKVLRGGSWFIGAYHTRSSDRDRNLSGDRYFYSGFRLLRTLPSDLGDF